jgi:hypothetical protein
MNKLIKKQFKTKTLCDDDFWRRKFLQVQERQDTQ